MLNRQFVLLIFSVALCVVAPAKEVVFKGACDASAAVALNEKTFVVADDEDNTLRIYSLERPGMPKAQYPLGRFLKVQDESRPEADIEACTRVGDRIYWITSHGRSKKGKWRGSRYRFFATKIIEDDGNFSLKAEGVPSDTLLKSLLAVPGLNLSRHVGRIGADSGGTLAPKEGGLNVEGLTVSADGSFLYIGLRNPVPDGEAILIPFKNAADVIAGKTNPMLGVPVKLDLRGRGIRSIEYSAHHGKYFLVGGSRSVGLSSAVYSWNGVIDSTPKKLKSFSDFNPEALVPIPGHEKIWLFSDDGTVMHRVTQSEAVDKLEDGMCPCKSLKDPEKKRFRSISIVVR